MGNKGRNWRRAFQIKIPFDSLLPRKAALFWSLLLKDLHILHQTPLVVNVSGSTFYNFHCMTFPGKQERIFITDP